MNNLNEFKGYPLRFVLYLTYLHRDMWKDKTDWFWVGMLLREFTELLGTLAGLRAEPIKLRLTLIAVICLSWILKEEA